MSKIPILVALLWLSVMSSLSAQGSFTTTSGASVRISGAAYFKLHNTQWDNNGMFTAGGSTLEFSGNHPAGTLISGFNPDVLKNLRINRSTGEVALLKNVVVTGNLSFSAGLFNLNGFNVTLPQPGGTLAGENESSRTFSSSTGEIQLIVNLNAPASANPGNLGAVITSAANLGNTIFRRGHLPFIGACNESIQRYFFIQPTNNTGLNATLRLHYFDAELNGVPENELILYRSDNGGASWTAVGFDTRNTTQNWVEKSGLSSLSMFTLADANWLSTKTWYLDTDTDNYYTGTGITQCASPGDGYRYTGLTGGGDCDDTNAAINPGATEITCNNVDENCNGMADDDPEAPVISDCPVGNQILNTNGNSSCELTIPTAAALGITATDNCVSPLPPINQSISFFTGTADGGTFAVDYTVTDGNGNTSTCTVTFEVNDDDAPVISNCPTNILLKTGDDSGADCEVQVTYTPPTFSDNCDGTGTATWASGPMSGASLNVVGSPYTVVYTKTDLAGNAVATDCSFTVTVQDDTKPTLACPSSNTLTPLSGNCTYTLSGTAYDPTGLSDNCGVAGVSNNFNNLATLAGAVLPTGANLIEWTVTDVNGLIHTCQFTLTVTACVEISGTIFWKGDGVAGVNNANMALSGEASNTDATDLNGDFDLVANTGDDFVITPSKNTGGMLNGLTAADATVIQRHLTGNELITDFYRLIAADCNRSNNISSVDAALIRQALLGNPSSLNILNAAGHWRFVRTDYVPVLAGPYTLDHYSLYNKRVLTGVSGMQLAQDFYGVKAGDVFEESNPGVDVADPTLKPDPDAKPLVWRVRDRLLKTGQTIELDFSVANFTDIAAYQYGMRFDPTVLQYQQASGTSTIVPLDEASNFGTWQIAKGELRTLWSVNAGKTLPGVQLMYRLRFKVLQGGKKLSEVLGLDPAILAALAYTSQLAQREVQLVFTDYVQPGLNIPDVLAGDYFDLLQNRPNPFSERTTIGFILPLACDAQLRVLDISGRELWRVDKTYPAGYHEEVIRLEEIGSTGMLFYELTTPQGKQTRKMLAVRL